MSSRAWLKSLNKPKRSSNPYQMSLFDREVSEKKKERAAAAKDSRRK